MSLLRSSNCSTYTDTISLLVEATASTPGDNMEHCKVDVPAMFSCQTSAFESPDDATDVLMRGAAKSLLTDKGCDTDNMTMAFRTNLVGAQQLEYSAKRLVDTGLASNCHTEGNNANHATHRAEARCHPMREMTDSKGRRVMNTHMTFVSNLSVCDVSEEAMPQLQEDLRKVAAYNAAENGLKVDSDLDLACNFSVLPQI